MADDFQLKWRANTLDCYPTFSGMKDYVFTVHWDCLSYYSGISGGPYYGRSYSATQVPSTATSGDYTPYEKLQESQVLDWVWNVIGAENKYQFEQNSINQIIDQLIPPVIQPPVPWPADVFPIISPSIVTQPSNLSLYSGTNGFLNVSAQGQPLYYQWYKDGIEVSGASGSALAFINVQPEQSGIYNVTINNSFGSVTSSGASLTVTYPELEAPTIVIQPVDTTVQLSGFTSFYSTAAGYPSPTYQWQFNGTDILDATGNGYSIMGAEYSNSGTYTLTASNYLGNAVSSGAFLTVIEPIPFIPMQ
jgi:hypothetical protein